jgi:hypothetical protein
MCRNCAGFDEKESADVWGAAFAHRDGKQAPKPAAPVDRQAAPAPEPKPLSRDQNHA